jgi:hypothetical protein
MEAKLEKIEYKIEKLDERLDTIDKHLAIYNEQLKIHIKRSETLEQEFKPVHIHVQYVNAGVKIILGVSFLLGVLATVKKIML